MKVYSRQILLSLVIDYAWLQAHTGARGSRYHEGTS